MGDNSAVKAVMQRSLEDGRTTTPAQCDAAIIDATQAFADYATQCGDDHEIARTARMLGHWVERMKENAEWLRQRERGLAYEEPAPIKYFARGIP